VIKLKNSFLILLSHTESREILGAQCCYRNPILLQSLHACFKSMKKLQQYIVQCRTCNWVITACAYSFLHLWAYHDMMMKVIVWMLNASLICDYDMGIALSNPHKKYMLTNNCEFSLPLLRWVPFCLFKKHSHSNWFGNLIMEEIAYFLLCFALNFNLIQQN
jgi:hypothetical protein